MQPDQDPNRSANAGKIVRLVRPSVVVLCGPAGCGKSTFAGRHFRPTQIISSDHCRALVCDDEQDQRYQVQAFALLDFIIEARLSINRLCVVDSTALTSSARRSLLDLARRQQVPCIVLLFEASLETCVARDLARGAQSHGRSVGRLIIERQHRMFEEAKSMIPHEGFDRIEALQEQDLDQIRFETVFRPAPRSIPAASRRSTTQFQHHPTSRLSGRERLSPAEHFQTGLAAGSRPPVATARQPGVPSGGQAAPPSGAQPAEPHAPVAATPGRDASVRSAAAGASPPAGSSQHAAPESMQAAGPRKSPEPLPTSKVSPVANTSKLPTSAEDSSDGRNES